MKVAIVHDILIEYGGAERVLDSLLEIYPRADLFTFYYYKKDRVLKGKYGKFKPQSSFLSGFQYLGQYKNLFSVFKPLALIYFHFLNLDKYDLVVTSSSSYNSKAVRAGIHAKHLCYLHTPPRYLYKEKNQMPWLKVFPFNILIFPLIFTLRKIDQMVSKNPSQLIVNSQEVQKRVRAYYKRNSVVIYPPVDLSQKPVKKRHGEFYLCLSRLVRHKGIELAISVSNKYKLPLKIVGVGYMRKSFENIAGKNVEFLGWVDDDLIPELFSKTKALIYCPIDEDFGIVPIEAMKHGVPVIGFSNGGTGETVIEGKTGFLFHKFDESSMYEAILKFQKSKLKSSDIRKLAEKFSKEKFRKRFLKIAEQS